MNHQEEMKMLEALEKAVSDYTNIELKVSKDVGSIGDKFTFYFSQKVEVPWSKEGMPKFEALMDKVKEGFLQKLGESQYLKDELKPLQTEISVLKMDKKKLREMVEELTPFKHFYDLTTKKDATIAIAVAKTNDT